MPRKNIMLCYPFEETRFKKWNQRGLYQHKLNGDRGRAILNPSLPMLFSSEEADRSFALPHIMQDIIKILPELNRNGIYELDGEFYRHGMAHEDIHSICSRTKNIHPDHELIEFHIFDHIVEGLSQHGRIQELEKIRSLIESTKSLKLVHTWPIESQSQMMYLYDRSISLNYEGMILRYPGAEYKRSRSIFIMKYKPGREDLYKIVGYKEEISIHGEPKGRIGSLIFQDPEGTEFSISAGLNDKDRMNLWKIRDTLNGRMGRVSYQTTSKYGVPKFATDVKVLD